MKENLHFTFSLFFLVLEVPVVTIVIVITTLLQGAQQILWQSSKD